MIASAPVRRFVGEATVSALVTDINHGFEHLRLFA